MANGSMLVSWKVVGAILGILTGGLAMAKTVVTVSELPKKLDEHVNLTIRGQDALLSKQDSLLRVMEDVRDIEQKLMCVKIAELRHLDWARCLVVLPGVAQ